MGNTWVRTTLPVLTAFLFKEWLQRCLNSFASSMGVKCKDSIFLSFWVFVAGTDLIPSLHWKCLPARGLDWTMNAEISAVKFVMVLMYIYCVCVLCMCLCLCVGAVHVSLCVCRPESLIPGVFFNCFTLVFEIGFLSEPEAYRHLYGCDPRDALAFASMALGLQTCTAIPSCLHGCWGSIIRSLAAMKPTLYWWRRVSGPSVYVLSRLLVLIEMKAKLTLSLGSCMLSQSSCDLIPRVGSIRNSEYFRRLVSGRDYVTARLSLKDILELCPFPLSCCFSVSTVWVVSV